MRTVQAINEDLTALEEDVSRFLHTMRFSGFDTRRKCIELLNDYWKICNEKHAIKPLDEDDIKL